MGKWAERARQVEERDPRANSANSADSSPIVTNGAIGTASRSIPVDIETGIVDTPAEPTKAGSVGSVGAPDRPISETQARSTLREWHGRLAPLDRSAPPEGIARNRWHQLVDDAWWLYESFASQLAREGWSALDIFGVLPGYDVGAVLLDRLKGARNLKHSGERAVWSHYGITSQTCRGCSDAVVSSGLLPIWELR